MNIRDAVITLIAEELGAPVDSVSESSSLANDLGADSPHLLEMALAIEELFGIEIPDRALARLETVRDVVTYVEGKTSVD